AAEALNYEIVTPPGHGTIAGAGPDRTYTPNRGFTGEDRFRWRAGSSNTATVTIAANATGINKPARASNQTIRTRPGEPVTFILRYSDVDGPGPYRVQIRKGPANGSATGLDNDITYTPNAGFRGRDTFEWIVRDGSSRSNLATATILVQD
ncbi:MAG: hypothetical protein GY953_53195, partial [bacterium]|nr:hypothetical protein [bacterium]